MYAPPTRPDSGKVRVTSDAIENITMQAKSKAAPVLIVGGGIGGLGTALALARKGIASHVIEQAPEFEEIGAGIQLGPNVFRMFEVLGLTGEMNKLAVFPQGLEFRDSMTGKTFVSLPIDHRFYGGTTQPYAVVHRADMLDVDPRRVQDLRSHHAHHLAEGRRRSIRPPTASLRARRAAQSYHRRGADRLRRPVVDGALDRRR